MALIETPELLKCFKKRLGQADRVDMAVAWAGTGAPLQALVDRVKNKKNKPRVRVVVGLSDYVTHPKALRVLKEYVELRIYTPERPGIWHPKFYGYYGPKRNVIWIGSANFTNRAFQNNVELVHEFIDDRSSEWFDRVWTKSRKATKEIIDNYEREWKRHAKFQKLWYYNTETWDDFVQGLKIRDRNYRQYRYKSAVFGKRRSYFHTIRRGKKLIRRSDWDAFIERELNCILGFSDQHGTWGFLGPVGKRHGQERNFRENRDNFRTNIRNIIHNIRDMDGHDNEELGQAAQHAVDSIMALPGCGPAWATRLLALCRPDRFVSVNGGSSRLLGQQYGLPTNPRALARRYNDLLTSIYQEEWFQHQEPDGRRDNRIWRYRVALLDAYAWIQPPG